MIFKIRYIKIKNLRGQLTALKPSERFEYGFKVFNGRERQEKMEKASQDRNTSFWQQQWGYLQRRQGTSGFYLEPAPNVAIPVTNQRTFLLPRSLHKLNWLGTGGSTVPLCLAKVGQAPKFLLYRKISQIFWAWQLKIDAAQGPWLQLIHQDYHIRVQGNCSDYWVSLCQF